MLMGMLLVSLGGMHRCMLMCMHLVILIGSIGISLWGIIFKGFFTFKGIFIFKFLLTNQIGSIGAHCLYQHQSDDFLEHPVLLFIKLCRIRSYIAQ